MNKKIEKAINKQINEEMFSAYLYLAMAAYLDSIGFSGFANWMKIQYQEEMAHAMKFYHYVYERGGVVEFYKLNEPKKTFKSVLAVCEESLEHEKHISKCINDLFELAIEEKDYAFQSFLKWYIDEQVEEEASFSDLIDKIRIAGEKGPGIFMLDKELGTRIFVDETKE